GARRNHLSAEKAGYGPMSRWGAFLRGINLGARQVKMAELKACLEEAGFSRLRTVGASGNVLLEAPGDAAALQAQLEKTITAAFGFEVGVVLRSGEELDAMHDDHPFGMLDRKADPTRHVLMFNHTLPAGLVLEDRPGNTEILRIDPREVYIAAYRQPNGRYTEFVEDVLQPLYAR